MVCLCSAVSLADLTEGWVDDAEDDGAVVYNVDDAYPQEFEHIYRLRVSNVPLITFITICFCSMAIAQYNGSEIKVWSCARH